MAEEAIQVPAGLSTDGLLGKRYMARFIDWTLVGVAAGAAVVAEGALMPDPRSVAALLLAGLTGFLLWIGYSAVFESSPWQATLGKRVMGLQVYDRHGGRLRFAQAAWRNVVKDLPFILLAPLPGGNIFTLSWLVAHIIVMHRSPVYQAIHDRVAHTWVAAPEGTTQLHLT